VVLLYVTTTQPHNHKHPLFRKADIRDFSSFSSASVLGSLKFRVKIVLMCFFPTNRFSILRISRRRGSIKRVRRWSLSIQEKTKQQENPTWWQARCEFFLQLTPSPQSVRLVQFAQFAQLAQVLVPILTEATEAQGAIDPGRDHSRVILGFIKNLLNLNIEVLVIPIIIVILDHTVVLHPVHVPDQIPDPDHIVARHDHHEPT